MVDIIKALNANEKETIKILKGCKDNTIVFTVWDYDIDEYTNDDECPWIRYTDDDGNLEALLVVAARYDSKGEKIELFVSDGFKKADEWIPLDYCDDISYWSVFEHIGKFGH